MHQISFSDIEYSFRKRTTKREEFLKAMDTSVPRAEWVSSIELYYPSGRRGRPSMGIERMLRMYLLQCWFNLSDEGIKKVIYDNFAFRSFMKINFAEERVPDATALLKFRHLLEKHGIGQAIFEAFTGTLEKSGYLMHGGTIVDATLIQAPSSTKNEKRERDPKMCQTKKGNQYYFGMKTHIGVDAGSGYVHSLETTAANVHDIMMASRLIREDDEVIYGNAGYIGIEKREEITSDAHLSSIEYRINRRVGSVQKVPGCFPNWENQIERRKSSVRSKVMEHPFLVVKRFFWSHKKTVYRGLAKNTHRHMCCSPTQISCVHPGWQTTARLRQTCALFLEKGAKIKKLRDF